jgi:hypothetical protein
VEPGEGRSYRQIHRTHPLNRTILHRTQKPDRTTNDNSWPPTLQPITHPNPTTPKVKDLAGDEVPILTLAPHVAASIANRSVALAPDWILPIYPFDPANPCSLGDLKSGRQCIRGFSVQGRIEKSRRNYTEVWEQIGGHRKHHTSSTVSNFRLNILGETVEAFSVPGGWNRRGRLRVSVGGAKRHPTDWLQTAPNRPPPPVEVRDLVAVYKNPPYPIFYGVVHHSFALVRGWLLYLCRRRAERFQEALMSGLSFQQGNLQPLETTPEPTPPPPYRTHLIDAIQLRHPLPQVPMLASELYYKSKFSSTVLTSLITSGCLIRH